jgi:5-methylcytosine-specific restriction protein A
MTHRHLGKDRDGRITNPKISSLLGDYAGPPDPRYPIIEAAFLRYCHEHNITPSKFEKTPRRYWVIGDVSKLPDADYRFPDEIEMDDLHEGAKVQVVVNKYERSAKAREVCIRHYGAQCTVCGLRFEERYGDIGKGCIHVHHVVPLNKGRRTYKVNPLRDLRPVCPNCHWMLHINGEAMSIKKLRAIVRKQEGKT